MITFVVRFWRDTSAGEGRWRGRIEHVQSGDGVAFLELEGMLRFMRRFRIAVGDEPVDDQGDHSPAESTRVLR
jgi:hypothetical protein